MAQKSVKTTQPVQKTSPAPKPAQKPQPTKKEGRLNRWYRETAGELRKVSWPTVPEARRLTGIVLAVMAAMAVLLGVLDFIFSRFFALIFA